MEKSFKLYGHRGARGLMPENTLPAYAKALETGVDFVDMDVVMTRDGVVVVYHDPVLNPDTTRDENGSWVQGRHPVYLMTFAELQKYDVGRINPDSYYATWFPDQVPVEGTRIPTLEAVIDYVKANGKPDIGFQIEIKDDPEHPEDSPLPSEMAKAVANILQAKNIVSRTEVQAFNWQCLLALQKINPDIATAYLTDPHSEIQMSDANPAIAGQWTGGFQLKDYGYSIPKMIRALGGKLWDPQDIEVTAEKLNAAHSEGLKMVTWSSPQSSGQDVDLALTQNLIDMGIDGIITDRPDKVALLRRRGQITL